MLSKLLLLRILRVNVYTVDGLDVLPEGWDAPSLANRAKVKSINRYTKTSVDDSIGLTATVQVTQKQENSNFISLS